MNKERVVGFRNKQGRKFAYNELFFKKPNLSPVYASDPEAKTFEKPIEGECVEVSEEQAPKPKKTAKRSLSKTAKSE